MPTEAEMKEKWCPHVRAIATWEVPGTDTQFQTIAVTVNRGAQWDACLCIGSACSQWDWGSDDLHYAGNPDRQGDCGLKR